jgi:DNA mismatch repair protein MutL
LHNILTFGFRGEALASIAAVAEVTLKTRREEDEVGCQVGFADSQQVSLEEIATPRGANFSVRNLFYNVPARRKFLKSDNVEFKHIVSEFTRVALTRPDVGFTLTHNGKDVFVLRPAKSLKFRIQDVLGAGVAKDVVDIHAQTSIVELNGYVGRPDSAKKGLGNQYFFVNGRYMRHPYFAKAVMEAFNGLVPDGEQVPYFLYLSIDPANIDVNISPTKTEIKFENEPAVWQIIHAGIKESLGRFSATPTIDFDSAHETDIPVMRMSHGDVKPPTLTIDSSYNPFVNSESTFKPRTDSSASRSKASTDEWAKFYDQLLPEATEKRTSETVMFPTELSGDIEIGSAHFQYRGQYVVSASMEGLMIVSQHRAHVRILYDRYIAQITNQENVTQGLLFPELLTLPPSEAKILESMIDEIRYLGFDVASIGGGSFSINGLPANIEGLSPQALLRDMVVSVCEGGSPVLADQKHRIALSLAKATAIVDGQFLSQEEMDVLMSDLLRSSNPNITPDGKTIIAMLAQEKIDKMFA